MNPLEDLLRELIEERGPLTFAEYMELALYHPDHGYYSRPDPQTGFGGHFVTASELGPEFGALWVRALEDLWIACGSPSRFDVVEIGPGEGGLATGLLEAVHGEFADALHLHLVERSPARRKRQRTALGDAKVTWHGSLKGIPSGVACVLANEVLDNLPVHVVERAGDDILEVYVDAGDTDLEERLLPPRDEGVLERARRLDLPDGSRAEVTAASEEFAKACADLVTRGAVFFVDYGLSPEERALRPRGTVVAYSPGGADALVLRQTGERDITAHADWAAVETSLRSAGMDVVGPVRQQTFLRALGIGDLDDALKKNHASALAVGRGAEALRALARRQVLGALTDPGGLGNLQLMAGFKGVAIPKWLAPNLA